VGGVGNDDDDDDDDDEAENADGEAATARALDRARPMGGVTFGELRLRLGAQYLFVHHGDCEHDVVFTRCSLSNPSDAADAARGVPIRYPRLVSERNRKRPMCVVCSREPAVWDVHGDRLADVLPCHLCQACHFQAHYTRDGEARRSDYRVYPLLFERADEGEGDEGVGAGAGANAQQQQQEEEVGAPAAPPLALPPHAAAEAD
jgi:hypothetical protein